MTTLITRRDAVKAIARHLAARTAFIVFAPPSLLAETTARLRRVPGLTGYLDAGRNTIAQADTRDFAALRTVAWARSTEVAAVLVVPKTVPAAVLSAALKQPIAEDGSQDILVISANGGPIHWPLLFVDALQRVDPAAAAQLHAEDIRRLS